MRWSTPCFLLHILHGFCRCPRLCCLPTPPFSHVTLHFLSEMTPRGKWIRLRVTCSWTDAVGETGSKAPRPAETLTICLLFAIICGSQACRRQPQKTWRWTQGGIELAWRWLRASAHFTVLPSLRHR